MDAAATVFMREGYAGASMDEITAIAGASKATVYRYFTDKQTLFCELIASTVKATSDLVQAEVAQLCDDITDVDAELRDLARRLLAAVMKPELMRLRRLIIGEASRFPALGRVFYEQGPRRTVDSLAGLLRRLADEGQLTVRDPRTAAAQLNWLILAAPLNQAMLLGDDAPLTGAELEAHADAAIGMFLAAHRG